MSPKWSVRLCFCDWKVVCIYHVPMHSTYVILSSVLLHGSVNAVAEIQGTIAEKKKTDEMILNSCKLTFQVNMINIYGNM